MLFDRTVIQLSVSFRKEEQSFGTSLVLAACCNLCIALGFTTENEADGFRQSSLLLSKKKKKKGSVCMLSKL